MQTDTVGISSVIPYARNPRRNDAAIAKVAASLQEFGWRQPIVVDEDMVVVAGHTRLEAARTLNMEEVPIHIAHGLTPEQIKAYRLADNRVGQEAEWDEELLRLELGELEGMDFALDLTGFDTDELAQFMAEPIEEGLTDPDEVPEVPEEPVTVLGDLWLLGKHRLVCGDSTSADDVEKLMGGQKADMAFTDPPYALFGNATGVAGISDDNMVRSFFRDVLKMLKVQSKPYAHIYVCCDWHSAFSIEAVSRAVELKAKNLCIWDKGDGGVGSMYQQCYEMVWFFDNSPINKTTMRTIKAGVRTVNGKPNIWRVKRHTTNRVHNAQKPVDLIAIPMLAGSDVGDCILDLFGGSGTTLISAEVNGRACRVMELDAKYCDVIVQRWENFTGKKAERVAPGQG